MAEHGDEKQLPGLNITNNQLFFLSYAQVSAHSLYLGFTRLVTVTVTSPPPLSSLNMVGRNAGLVVLFFIYFEIFICKRESNCDLKNN